MQHLWEEVFFSITHINGDEFDTVKQEDGENHPVFDKLYNTLKTLLEKKEVRDGKHKN